VRAAAGRDIGDGFRSEIGAGRPVGDRDAGVVPAVFAGLPVELDVLYGGRRRRRPRGALAGVVS
jgi:hypothetical protein